MFNDSHLVFHDTSIQPATEWSVNLQGWLFLRVLQGEGYAFGKKAPLQLSEGDTLVHAPGRSCQLRASQLGELRVQFFQVFPELLTGTISTSEQQALKDAAQQENIFPLHRAAASPFAQQFAILSKQASISHTMLVRCELLHLAAMILADHLPPSDPKPNYVLTAKQRFEALVTQMVEGQWRHQTVDELARQCGCGVRHFSRLFRLHFGHSLGTKRIVLSLHKAKKLLQESDAKIIDVAMDSGFNSVGLFTSRFKKHFKCTPSEWRKRHGQPVKASGKKKSNNLRSRQAQANQTKN